MERITPGTGFYLEFNKTEIRLFTQHGCSTYPIWLGKNRAVMKKIVAILREDPPLTLVDFLDMVSKYNLTGLGSNVVIHRELLTKHDKGLDKPQLFF